MPFFREALPNGLQLLGETSTSARSAALGFFVRTGSRDEVPEVSGVTHFLEHMIFKGTPHRSAFDVNRDFDRIGADYNAYTSEENTVFHACVLPEYLPQAVDILADILRPSLRQDDFDLEKEVIIEEIKRYKDTPLSSAYDQAKQAYFADHKLGNSILGSEESITALTRQQMQDYFDRRYVAPNILVVVAGRFDWPELVELVRQKCGHWKSGPIGRDCIRPTTGSGRFVVQAREQLMQEHVVMMAPGPAADSALRHSADLLGMAIGDDSGSRYYWELVDPGLADSADCGFHEYEGTGAFYSFLGCEPDDTEKNLAIIHQVLQTIGKEGITEAELTQARNKALSRVVRGNERPEGRMGAVGAHWTYQGEYRTVDEDLEAYENVTLKSIREVLDRFPIDNITTFALGPLTELQPPNGKQ
jgi:predicted Zn-dependent peptidase